MALATLLKISYPLIQAPMAGAQNSALAIAVSNAGGLGSLPAALLSPEDLRREIKKIQEHSSNPFNVNFFCHEQPIVDESVEKRWREALRPYYNQYELDITAIPNPPVRQPIQDAHVKVLEELRPPVVSFHFGLPLESLLTRIKNTNALVMSTATTVEEAIYLEQNGVDAIIAQGLEAGGHRGMFLETDISTQMTTRELLLQILKHVRVPVIAAGGLSEPVHVRDMMRLGAAGVQIGTAYLLSHESTVSPQTYPIYSQGGRLERYTIAL